LGISLNIPNKHVGVYRMQAIPDVILTWKLSNVLKCAKTFGLHHCPSGHIINFIHLDYTF